MVKFKRAWLSQSNLDFMTTRIVWSIHFYLLGDTFGMIFPPRRCYKIFSNLMLLPRLTLFFSMFPFDSPENIRKPLVFWCFQGNQKGTLGRKGFMLESFVMLCPFIKDFENRMSLIVSFVNLCYLFRKYTWVSLSLLPMKEV